MKSASDLDIKHATEKDTSGLGELYENHRLLVEKYFQEIHQWVYDNKFVGKCDRIIADSRRRLIE